MLPPSPLRPVLLRAMRCIACPADSPQVRALVVTPVAVDVVHEVGRGEQALFLAQSAGGLLCPHARANLFPAGGVVEGALLRCVLPDLVRGQGCVLLTVAVMSEVGAGWPCARPRWSIRDGRPPSHQWPIRACPGVPCCPGLMTGNMHYNHSTMWAKSWKIVSRGLSRIRGSCWPRIAWR